MYPAADLLEASIDLVRSLLASQHADLADLPLAELPPGWDNTLWQLGDELLVRLPRRQIAVPLTLHEQRWLPQLAPRLPLPVPAPVRTGRPCPEFPWPWSIVPRLHGQPGDKAPITRPGESAERLGRFLRALHEPAPPDAPFNPYRSVSLTERAPSFGRLIGRLEQEVDVAAAGAAWDDALQAEAWSEPSVWVHGDLHPANTLFADGRLAAIVDFGDVCAGDPATDLAAGWLLLPASALPRFFEAYGEVDSHTRRRARGWALLFALMLISIGSDGRPTYGTVGRLALDRLLAAGSEP